MQSLPYVHREGERQQRCADRDKGSALYELWTVKLVQQSTHANSNMHMCRSAPQAFLSVMWDSLGRISSFEVSINCFREGHGDGQGILGCQGHRTRTARRPWEKKDRERLRVTGRLRGLITPRHFYVRSSVLVKISSVIKGTDVDIGKNKESCFWLTQDIWHNHCTPKCKKNKKTFCRINRFNDVKTILYMLDKERRSCNDCKATYIFSCRLISLWKADRC